MITLALLCRKKKLLDSIEMKIDYGFLYIGYRRKYFYW